jgi:hypothetical protein
MYPAYGRTYALTGKAAADFFEGRTEAGRARTARLQVIETCRKLKKGEWLTQADTVSRRGPVLAIQPSRQNLGQEPEKQKPGTEPRDEYLPARNSNTADEATG